MTTSLWWRKLMHYFLRFLWEHYPNIGKRFQIFLGTTFLKGAKVKDTAGLFFTGNFPPPPYPFNCMVSAVSTKLEVKDTVKVSHKVIPHNIVLSVNFFSFVMTVSAKSASLKVTVSGLLFLYKEKEAVHSFHSIARSIIVKLSILYCLNPTKITNH